MYLHDTEREHLLKFCAQGTSCCLTRVLALPGGAIASGEKDREGEGQRGEKEWVVRLSRRKREDEGPERRNTFK